MNVMACQGGFVATVDLYNEVAGGPAVVVVAAGAGAPPAAGGDGVEVQGGGMGC